MASPLDMTGFWIGEYRYNPPRGLVVSFIANLDDAAGALSGSISEPNVYSDSTDRHFAFVLGQRSGVAVAFSKTYDGAGDFAHRVDYEGRLSDDGLRLDGRWTIRNVSGPFWMSRTDPGLDLSETEEVDIEMGVSTR